MATVTPAAVPRKRSKSGAASAGPQPQAVQERPEAAIPPGRSILRKLGLIGLDRIEPVILAALVQREPLLLVGNHGTGKSLLLNRLAQALGLEHRHYNASLLSFDDLVGYPLPDPNGALRFVQTPASIWGAQSVFFDEISRCRPEMQNKLFSLIHERRVQGIDLERLIYRWSAMNPPGADAESSGYIGSEPLDLALADRFAYIVRVPDWSEMAGEDQERLLHAAQEEPDSNAPEGLRRIVSDASTLYETMRDALLAQLARYVQTLAALLAQGKVAMSGRRAAMLVRNICSIHAVRLCCLPGAHLGDSAELALAHSLPQLAVTGEEVPRLKLASAHREAWSAVDASARVPAQSLLSEPDPIRRAKLAASLTDLPALDFSAVISDCLTQAPEGARQALAIWLFEQGHAGRLLAAVAEQCAGIYTEAVAPITVNQSHHPYSPKYHAWKRIADILGAREKKAGDYLVVRNILFGLFNRGVFSEPNKVDEVWKSYLRARNGLSGGVS
jgi:MoxR-like ATPase